VFVFSRATPAFLLVYDITSSSSFDDLQPIYDRLLRAKDCDEKTAAARIPIVLVGNKCDLEVRSAAEIK
jgi:GTPase SAR1 family protein